LALITQGDLENKISEIFKMKDQLNRGSIEIASALQIIDWLGDVLAFINEIDQTLNFRSEWFDLSDKLIRKLRTMKSVGCREITVCINDHPLRNLFLEPNQRDIFAIDYRIQIEHHHRKTLQAHEITEEERHHRQEELKKIIQEEANLILEEKAANIDNENERFQREAANLTEQSNLSTLVTFASNNLGMSPDQLKDQALDYVQDQAKDYAFDKASELIKEKTGYDVNVENVFEGNKEVIVETVEKAYIDAHGHKREEIVEQKVIGPETTVPQGDMNSQINNQVAARSNNPNRQKPEDTGSCKVCSIF